MAHPCARGIIIPLLIEIHVVIYRYNMFNTTLIIYNLRNRKNKDDRRPVLFHTFVAARETVLRPRNTRTYGRNEVK